MREQGRRAISSRLSRCILLPLRRVRDSYIRGMTGLSDRMQFGAPIAAYSYPCFSGTDGLQSFSSAMRFSSDEDLRDLIRAASVGRAAAAGPPADAMRRSQSAAVGRIDEDAPCDFPGEMGVGESLIFAKSRTCATRRKKASVAHS